MSKKKASAIESIFADVKKTFGSEGLFAGDDEFIADVQTIPSGSLALDDAIGPWGIPRGRIVQYAGPESGGKTLMSLMAIREWQRRDPKNCAVFVDAETTFSGVWAAKLGVDTRPHRLMVLRQTDNRTAADLINMICGVPHHDLKKTGKVKPGILDGVREHGGADASGLGLIVLDSLAALRPPLEVIAEAGKINIAPLARFLPPELRRLTPMLGETGVSMIVINQLRIKVGDYGNPEDTPGGRALKHAISLTVNFARINKKESYIIDEETGEIIGHHVRAKILKNKVGTPSKVAEFSIKYLQGVVNTHEELADLAVKYGVISRAGSHYSYNGNKLANGKDNLYEFLGRNSNKQMREKMLQEIHEAKAQRTKLTAELATDPEDGGE